MLRQLPDKFFDCRSCTIKKQCFMPSVVLERISLDQLELKFEIFQANELVLSKVLLENKILIVRTGSLFKELIYKKNKLSLFDIYFPGEVFCLDSNFMTPFDVKIKSLETSSICFLNASSVEQNKNIYCHYLKSRLNYLEDNNYFKQLLLTQRNPIKRVTLFFLTIIKRKQLIVYDDIQLKINLSRKLIGLYLGLAEETIVRSLSQLSQLNLIIVNNKNYIIPNYQELFNYYAESDL